MVKGLSRQVIVVKDPDPKLFEQAIFIVRNEVLKDGGISEQELLRQARLATGYNIDVTDKSSAEPRALASRLMYMLAGMLLTLCGLLLVRFVFS